MSEPRRATAFVLRKVNYGDKDLIVTVLGRQTGKFSAIARGARASKKRFGGGLQPMRCLQMTYSHKSGRNLAFLREIDVVEDFPALEANFERITIASYATELVRELSQEAHAEPQTFDLLRSFYGRLGEADDAVLAMEAELHHFELSLLELHGALPSLYACFRCHKPADQMQKHRCTRTGEGLICTECLRAGEPVGVLAQPTVELLRYFYRPDARAPEGLREPSCIQQARRVIDASFRQMLDQPLKSRAMLETVFDSAPA